MNADKLRPGQRRALNVILSRVRARESKTAIIIPTRYGKSDLIRLSSLLAKEEGIVSGSIVLSPSTFLRNQIVRKDEVDGMAFRYGLDSNAAHRLRTLTSLGELRPFSNGEYLLSSTIQLPTRDIGGCVDLVESCIYQTGKPLLIHIDECHETGEDKRRGELITALEGVGALFSLYTATAIRADGDIIPGFKVKELSSTDIRRYVVRDAGDGTQNRIDVYDGDRLLVELEADHRTTFQEAWNESPSPLCGMSREVVDVNLRDLSDDEEDISLSGSTPAQARRYIGKAVWHQLVIRLSVELFVNELRRRRRVDPQIAGIIFTSNDVDRENNRHAKAIAKEIHSQAPEFQTCVVTMKSEEGDEKSTKQLERFVGINGKKGEGDIVLLKQMGGSGLNIPRAKVLLDLSPIRTVASVVQRITRVATPYNRINTCTVITLADPLMDAIWRKYVIEEGGWVSRFQVDADLTKVDSYLKDKPDPEEQKPLFIVSADIHGFDNHRGQSGDIDYLDFVNDLFDRLPAISNVYTKAELSESLVDFTIPTRRKSSRGEKPLGQQIKDKQAEVNGRVKELAQGECPYTSANPNPHVNRKKYWMSRAKEYAGIDRQVELKDISDLSTLNAMCDYLKKSILAVIG